MTRIAPTLTLLAVAALGGGMFVANAVNDPGSGQPTLPTPAAAIAPAAPAAGGAPAGSTVISLGDIPVVGAEPDAAAAPAGVPGDRTELSLAQVPVVGAPAPGPGAAAGRTEISLADLPVAQPASAPGPAPAAAADGAPQVFAGRTDDSTKSVALAVQGDRAEGYVCQRGKVEAWLSGTATGGTLSLQSKTGRTTLTGTVAAADSTGTVTINGAEFPFTVASTDVASAAASGRADVGKVAARLGGAG